MQSKKVSLSYSGYLQNKNEPSYDLFYPEKYHSSFFKIIFTFNEDKNLNELKLEGYKNYSSTTLKSVKKILDSIPHSNKINSVNNTDTLIINFNVLNPEAKQTLMTQLYYLISDNKFNKSTQIGRLHFLPLFPNPIEQLNLLEAIKSFGKLNGVSAKNGFIPDNTELKEEAKHYNKKIISKWFKIFLTSVLLIIVFSIAASILSASPIAMMILGIFLVTSAFIICTFRGLISELHLKRIDEIEKLSLENENTKSFEKIESQNTENIQQVITLKPTYPGDNLNDENHQSLNQYPIISTYPTNDEPFSSPPSYDQFHSNSEQPSPPSYNQLYSNSGQPLPPSYAQFQSNLEPSSYNETHNFATNDKPQPMFYMPMYYLPFPQQLTQSSRFQYENNYPMPTENNESSDFYDKNGNVKNSLL